MREGVSEIKQGWGRERKGWPFLLGLIFLAGLSALFSLVQQRHTPWRCSLDGSLINPVYEVEIIHRDQSSRKFSCVLNAQIWLERNEEPVCSVWVTDEVTGQKIRAEEACYVSSAVITTPHTGNKIHVFAQKGDAQAHARQFKGQGVPNPLRNRQKKPVSVATYRQDSTDIPGLVLPSCQKPLCLPGDTPCFTDGTEMGVSRKDLLRLPRGFPKPLDKPPKAAV